LAVYFPWPIGEKADMFAPTPDGIKPEWYFLFMFETLKLAPSRIFGMEGEFLVIMGIGFAATLWALSPFLDRKAQRVQPSTSFTAAGILVITYIIVMTVYSYAKSAGH